MPKTVLVVANNVVKLDFYRSLLSFHGYDVTVHSSYINIIKMIQTLQPLPSLIFIYFEHKYKSSIEKLIEQIQRNNRFKKLPIIVQGNLTFKERFCLKRIGFDGVLKNNLPNHAFIATVKKFISHKKQPEKFSSHAHLAIPVADNGHSTIPSDQLITIIETLDLIHMTNDLESLLNLIFRETEHLIEFKQISITLRDQNSNRLVLYRRITEQAPSLQIKPITLSAINGPGKVFTDPEILIQDDIRTNVQIQFEFEEVLSSAIRSAVIIPLIAKGELVGTLNIGNPEPNYYTMAKIKVLRVLTVHIASAISNTLLSERMNNLVLQLNHAMLERDAEVQQKYYHLSLLNNIGYAMQGTVDLDKLLYLILTCVTAGGAIGFNRAVLMRVDMEQRTIKGVMGVGPASGEEAKQIWANLSKSNWTLDDFLKECNYLDLPKSKLDQIARKIELSLDDKSDFIVMSIVEKRPFLISDGQSDPRVNKFIKEHLGVNEFVIVPLLARDNAIGVIIADNLFSGNDIDKNNVQLLSTFAHQAGLALERAEAYDNLTHKMAELHQAYLQLQETQNKLVRSERLATIGKMAAHVAHEIRNPLATIGGFAHAMFKYPYDGEKVKANAEIIREEVYRLERILQNVLDFTKPSLPILKMDNINKIITDTINLLHKEIQGNIIKITMELDDSIPEFLVDQQQIKQAFINICKNAIYSILEQQDSRSERVIGITSSTQGKYVKITISDTGKGMTQEVLENLFNPFFTTRPGGAGLGLAVTRKIIEEHGGYIEIKTKVGKGSNFIVCLPLHHSK